MSALVAAGLLGWLALQGQEPGPQPETEQAFVESTVGVVHGTRLVLADMDGDGARDLVVTTADAIAVHFLEAGRYAAVPDVRLEWPATRLGWDVTDLEGDGRSELVLLVEGARVVARSAGRSGFEEPRLLLDGARSYLPLGVWRTGIVRDVDGDGKGDLVLPGPGRFRIHLQRDGGFGEPLEVAWRGEIEIRTGDPGSLGGNFGQEVRLPIFGLEDADGDGRRDLVAQDEDVMQVYLADPELPREPTWTFDKVALRESLRRDEGLNLDDLFSNLPATVSLRLFDLDGRPPRDLILQAEGTFKVYLGGSRTGPRREADQVLKASGNVLYFVVRDVLGDGLPELQLIRAEKISLASVVRWLVLPGSLDFDVFTYRNQGGAFDRKPTRRNTLSVRIPRLLALEDEIDDIEEALDERKGIPARLFRLEADGAWNDVVDVRAGRVVVAAGAVPLDFKDRSLTSLEHFDVDSLLEMLVLEELDGLEDGAVKTIAIEDWKKLDLTPGYALRQASAGARTALTHALSEDFKPAGALSLKVVDLDGDGRSDVIVHGEGAEEWRVLQVLVQRR